MGFKFSLKYLFIYYSLKQFIMKKLSFYLLALAIGSFIIFSSCSKEDQASQVYEDALETNTLKASGPSVNGQGTFLYGEDIRHFSFHAKTMPNGEVKGSGVLTYNGGVQNIKFDIDCVTINGNTAILTGLVTSHRMNPDREGWFYWVKVVDNGEGSGDTADQLTLFYQGGGLNGDCSLDYAYPLNDIEGGNIQVKP